MKTYRHIYEEVISDENIELAIKETCKSRKKSRRKQRKLNWLKSNPDRVTLVRGWISHYYPIRRNPHEIYDGIARKKRFIYVPSVRETVVQHALVQILNKYLMRGVYEHTYAAIKGRGQHKAKGYIERYIRKNPKKVKYYLKLDIKQYFPSIPQEKVIEKLAKQIKDEKAIKLMEMILYASESGIPLGYYISQWIANFYLRDFDHAVKGMIGRCLYVRWMDDMVIFSPNKRDLHRHKDAISEMLAEMGLTLKENWCIQRFDHPKGGCFLDYMGFRFYRTRTTLRRSIYMKMCRKAKRIASKEKVTIYDIRQFMSYLGWIKHSDTYGAYIKHIKPYANIQRMKRRISSHDRNLRKAAEDNHRAGGATA